VPFLIKSEFAKKNKIETIKALKRLYKNAQGTHLEKTVRKSIKNYYKSTDISHETWEGLIELQNIISRKLRIDSQIALHNMMNIMFNIGYSQVASNKDLNDIQKGEIMIRIMLFLVGVEDETLVKTLGKEWKVYLKSNWG